MSRDQRGGCLSYLITFACYGCHLHGNESGSVDRSHNLFGGTVVAADAQRVSAVCQRMDQRLYRLDQTRREIVLASLLERCNERHWRLLAAHVRTNHFHLVVEAEVPPERIMNDLKSFASRCLNIKGLEAATRKRWARHGSTRWLLDTRGCPGGDSVRGGWSRRLHGCLRGC